MLLLDWLTYPALILAAILLSFFSVRIWDTRRLPPLEPWHVQAPSEPGAAEIDAGDWRAWLAAEDQVLAETEAGVTRHLEADGEAPFNRYVAESPVHPGRFDPS